MVPSVSIHEFLDPNAVSNRIDLFFPSFLTSLFSSAQSPHCALQLSWDQGLLGSGGDMLSCLLRFVLHWCPGIWSGDD